jgi:hypothetical protein
LGTSFVPQLKPHTDLSIKRFTQWNRNFTERIKNECFRQNDIKSEGSILNKLEIRRLLSKNKHYPLLREYPLVKYILTFHFSNSFKGQCLALPKSSEKRGLSKEKNCLSIEKTKKTIF